MSGCKGFVMATALAEIGHNSAAMTPYEAIKLHIDDLFETAQGFLDGDPIATEAQATSVSQLLDDARKARKAAEDQRKIEAKPFDDGKAAVQALWTPLTDEKKGRCALIADTCKKALAPWLQKLEDEKKAIAEAARKEAEEKAAAARAAAWAAEQSNITEQDRVEALRKEAAEAERFANSAAKDRAHATGGSRANTLRTSYRPVLTDSVSALKHYRERQPEALKDWLQMQAEKDVRSGSRAIPGFDVIEERQVV